ncbi:MAG TPA: DMT family transporter [Candidatus Sulfotelmatobacter sp.]|nr:DMT family transporter [Candidatus Sulfotelmatobacter sp.]
MTTVRVLSAQNDILRGIVYMTCAVSMFPFINASAKYLTAAYPITEIVWARFAGHLVFVVLAFFPRLRWSLFTTARPAIQIMRSMLLLASTSLFVSAIGRLPLATASAIGFASPFIVTALSVPVLRERVGPRRWSAVVVGFIGVLIVIRPGAGFANWAALLVLGSTSCYAIYQVITRLIALLDKPETGIVYAALVGTIVMSAIAPFDWRLPGTALDWLLFGCLGFFGGFGHYFVIKAYRCGPAAVIAPFSYGELVGSTTIGYYAFGNFPDAWTWLGASIIVSCGVYIAYREGVRRQMAAAPRWARPTCARINSNSS